METVQASAQSQSESEEDKKVKEYAKTALLGGILVVCMGFGFGIVNLLLMIITLGTGIWALKKNQGKDKKVARYCSIGIGLIIFSAILGVFIEGAPVGYFVKDILFPVTESMGIKL